MDDLEVVDEPVRLGEVAVTVDVVPVLAVEGLQVCRDLGHRLARVELASTQTAMASRISALVESQTIPPQ